LKERKEARAVEDEKIVELYLARDESAIARTAEKYGAALRKTAERILRDAGAAEECENETYLEAWGLIPPHEPKSYLFAFLGRITRHLAIDECRKRESLKRQGLFCELTREMEECIPAGSSAEERADAEALKSAVNAFLDKCSREQRDVFLRRYWFFDTVGAICARYGFSKSKVKTMLFRMREGLRRHLEREGYII
jgi:RNA polymerase sigma-70 factor (ECF subfamily)